MTKTDFADGQTRLAAFYDQLPNKKKIFYIFLSGGLTFLLLKSLSTIHKDKNIVIIGSLLAVDEINLITSETAFPLFNFPYYLDDREIWTYLFQINQFHFGWIDVDCFVLNDTILDQLAAIDASTAINGIWRNKKKRFRHITILNTYLLFLNINCINEIQSVFGISPRVYTNKPVDSITYTTAERLTEEHKAIVSKYAISIEEELDTLQLYQLAALYLGYKLTVLNDSSYEFITDTYSYYSPEIIHLGGSCSFSPVRLQHYKPQKNPGSKFNLLSSEKKKVSQLYYLIYFILIRSSCIDRIYPSFFKSFMLFYTKKTNNMDYDQKLYEMMMQTRISEKVFDFIVGKKI